MQSGFNKFCSYVTVFNDGIFFFFWVIRFFLPNKDRECASSITCGNRKNTNLRTDTFTDEETSRGGIRTL